MLVKNSGQTMKQLAHLELFSWVNDDTVNSNSQTLLTI